MAKKIHKIANPEGLTEEQIAAVEAYMNRACNSPVKTIVTMATLSCSSLAIQKILDALVKIATETVKVNPFAKIAITIGKWAVSYVAGNIIAREVDRVYDDTVESIALAKIKLEELIKKAQEDGEDTTQADVVVVA